MCHVKALKGNMSYMSYVMRNLHDIQFHNKHVTVTSYIEHVVLSEAISWRRAEWIYFTLIKSVRICETGGVVHNF